MPEYPPGCTSLSCTAFWEDLAGRTVQEALPLPKPNEIVRAVLLPVSVNAERGEQEVVAITENTYREFATRRMIRYRRYQFPTEE